MTDAPDLEPAALEACPFCDGEPQLIDGGPGNFYVRCVQCNATGDDGSRDYALSRWNRRAARSAPEAGKAVDETLTAMAGFLVFLKDMRFTGSWDLATLNRAIEVGETIAEQQAALASVPAPSGAEPVAREVAWLIERRFPADGLDGPQHRWYAENRLDFHWWTNDAKIAKKFPTKADAEAFPAYQMIASDPTISLTEHVFLATPQAAPAEEIAARRALSGASE